MHRKENNNDEKEKRLSMVCDHGSFPDQCVFGVSAACIGEIRDTG